MSSHEPVALALADTSLFVAVETRRPLADLQPTSISVSVVTIGELRLGVLTAADSPTRARRMETLTRAEALEPIPIDARVAHVWAALRVALRDAGKQMPLNDSWIAATAIAHHLPVVSQDDDYDAVPGLRVIKV